MYSSEVTGISRWRITGRLKTSSPLHIGDGGTLPIKKRDGQPPDSGVAEPDYATVFVDYRSKPVIPATSLKGALRSWAQFHLDAAATKFVDHGFGYVVGKEDHYAGAVTFHDAVLVKEPDQPDKEGTRFYDPKRLTCLTPSVVLNPQTRTAEEGLLYYTEFVPAGAEFEVVIEGQEVQHTGTEPERIASCEGILALLETAFRPGLSIGSGEANGWGTLHWSLAKTERMDCAAIAAWLNRDASESWTSAFQSAKPIASVLKQQKPPVTVTIALDLAFDGAMLVNDPSRVRTGAKSIAHAAIQSPHGDRYILPATSVRGALRAQAERICNTITPVGVGLENVVRRSQLNKLHPFLRLFGAGGWRSPIQIADFELKYASKTHSQEFVAIDRFTGGAAGSRKFNAIGLWKPQFHGKLVLDIRRLDTANVGDWKWLLLAYVLRDWMEGDGYIGFGRSKGYGAFRATIAVTGDVPHARLLNDILERKADALESPSLEHWELSLFEQFGTKEARHERVL